MAILAKIRQRTLVLILIIGLALFAFVISDVFNNNGGDKQPNNIGTVNGESISRAQFQDQVEYGKNLSRGTRSTMQVVSTIWDEEVKNTLITQQLDELGITIEKDEIWNLLTSNPNITNDPRFQDESGTFVEAKLREYVNNLEATKNSDAQKAAEYNSWIATENYVVRQAKRDLYYNLVKAGSIATVKEAEMAYRMENDKVTFKYAYVPYTSIIDSLVEIKKSDVLKYMENHKSEFEEKESRDIQYVYFQEIPSKSDEEETMEVVKGYKKELAAAEDAVGYANENTEVTQTSDYFYKNQLPSEHADAILAMQEGDVYGPYKVANQYKISRLVEAAQLPDSVKSRHILVRYAGTERAAADITRTKEEAEKLADSLLNVIKKNKSKFADLAKEFSSDPGSAEKGGDLGWYNNFTRGQLTPAFKDFIFEKEQGAMDIVETPFGFHIIEILEQKNNQKVVKLATIAKEVEVTEKTLSDLFTESSKFESDAGKSNTAFVDVAKEKGYNVNPVNKIKELDDRISGMAEQRQIVRWAFEDARSIGDIKRFNIGSGFLVVQLTAKHDAGLPTVEEASARVLTKLRNEKKAEMIKEMNAGKSMEEIASANGSSVQQATSLSMAAPMVPGVGPEQKVVGAAFALEQGTTSDLIAGQKGVFKIEIVNKVSAPAKDSYLAEMNMLKNQRAVKATNSVFEALKSAAEIEDNRAVFY
ncbi:peptidylprolyl isomerase [Kordia zhangzhouensis]|uniref:peptidylprolyl isomerase n=1 Tax=Kordia zhangzhouensis TaxID=1620405 RepID=UPI00062920F6|nr:peptidylprolyl isomerase [Kordia zhangzhouensis]